ncbi:hypothetical protein BATDEDRAFT_35416 [Batrachochytrium dendrobatidis JAM81]|uniref:Uncharacterized protein n=1 Tax=Batrachochytrium dendrobatidis (strain JAM81 / FGSC 10211) TaxID=684364 RepID=F4P5Z1_BATDJ|nr:uncharacterized protein BATDEDRAFT_35416 [Batrachochytrium dendrobatidis JAM81]EGF79512.1 hypothetical protein BATDEDRAFT_35416 [Batrachochytrium dendrobatidis JAM81]|eukprot:XP_006679992.1 hypothetical protein BATDEDRAFT_35416 [Batrachochytrium dendrobatidis JAM81]
MPTGSSPTPGRPVSTSSSLMFDFGMESSLMSEGDGGFADSLLSSFGLSMDRPLSLPPSANPTTASSISPEITRASTTTLQSAPTLTATSSTGRSSILQLSFPQANGFSTSHSSSSIDYLQRPFSNASSINSASANASTTNALSHSATKSPTLATRRSLPTSSPPQPKSILPHSASKTTLTDITGSNRKSVGARSGSLTAAFSYPNQSTNQSQAPKGSIEAQLHEQAQQSSHLAQSSQNPIKSPVSPTPPQGRTSPSLTRQRVHSHDTVFSGNASPSTAAPIAPSSPSNRFSASFASRSSAVSAFTAIIDSRRTSAVKDTAVAMDFEKMLNTKETKKLTSTPERMRHIEIKKIQDIRLVAKDAAGHKDEGINTLLRDGKSKVNDTDSVIGDDALGDEPKPKKNETYWEFLRNTGPEEQAGPKYFPPKPTTSSTKPLMQQLASPPSSPSTITNLIPGPSAQPIQRMTSLKEMDLDDDAEFLMEGQKRKNIKDMSLSEFLKSDPPASRSSSTTPAPLVKKTSGFRLFRNSKSSLQSNSSSQLELGTASLSDKQSNSGSMPRLIPVSVTKDIVKPSSSIKNPSIANSAVSGQNNTSSTSHIASSPLSATSLSTTTAGKRNSRLSLLAPESLKDIESHHSSDANSSTGSDNLTDRWDSQALNTSLSMHQVALGLGELDKDFASVLGDFNDWSNFGSSSTKNHGLLPYMTAPGQPYHTSDAIASKSIALDTSNILSEPSFIPARFLVSVATETHASQTDGPSNPSVIDTAVQTDFVEPSKAIVSSKIVKHDTSDVSIQTTTVEKKTVSTSPHVPVAKLLFLQHSQDIEVVDLPETKETVSLSKSAQTESINPGTVSAVIHKICSECTDDKIHDRTLNAQARSLSQQAIYDAIALVSKERYIEQHGSINAETQYDLEQDAPEAFKGLPPPPTVENPINMALVDENLKHQQEIAALKLALASERSKSQHMLILKEASEARFEQLARVAHRKLLNAVSDKQKLLDQQKEKAKREQEKKDASVKELKRQRDMEKKIQQEELTQKNEQALKEQQDQKRTQQQLNFQQQQQLKLHKEQVEQPDFKSVPKIQQEQLPQQQSEQQVSTKLLGSEETPLLSEVVESDSNTSIA